MRKVSRSKECKLYPGKGTTISQPTQKSFSYLQSTREIYVETDNDNQDISVDGHAIERMGQIKLLGVQIDEKLNFTSHITELCTKASGKEGVLVRLPNLIPCNARLSLYKSSILFHQTYCHLVWHFCNASDQRKLVRIQERSLRAVYKSRSASYQELLDRAKLPTLYNRRLQDIATLMFKVISTVSYP